MQSVTIEVVYQSWDVYTEKVKGQQILIHIIHVILSIISSCQSPIYMLR